MLLAFKNIYAYRELLGVLAWKNIVVRYKQAYFGVAWAIMKPVMMMLIFTLLRSFVDIDSGGIPYPLLAFSALLPWVFFQESTTDGVSSVTNNAHLIKKVYFPREVLPLTAVLTRLLDFVINFVILLLMMAWFGIMPTVHVAWVPLLVLYVILATLGIALVGAAMNCYYRDVSSALPILLTLLMYASPVIYPLTVVRDKFLEKRIAGDWSESLYTLYCANPLAGIIDAFQRTLLRGEAPDFDVMMPGMIVVGVLLIVSYSIFKRAESWFADVI
ncbi:ABC transporter permease [Methyloversatilis sp.]|uniref:ABC transporter permease n=1 Tax=Methyloversatilis sp. TaxID=2569862 RepID=UPI0035AF36D6